MVHPADPGDHPAESVPTLSDLRSTLERAKYAITKGALLDASRLIDDAIDLMSGAYGPDMLTEPRLSWFVVSEDENHAVVERLPGRRLANIVVCWCNDPGEAQTIALLLADNEASPNPRVSVASGRRAGAVAAQQQVASAS